MTGRLLIVLRGVTGVGKSCTAKALVEYLGRDKTTRLNMDQILPEPLERNILSALRSERVIAEIYSGRQNLANPILWITRFKEAGYIAISIRLDISLEAGRTRCLKRDPDRRNYDQLYHRFYHDLKFTEFPDRAKVEEFSIDVENKDTKAICGEVLKLLEQLV